MIWHLIGDHNGKMSKIFKSASEYTQADINGPAEKIAQKMCRIWLHEKIM